MPLMNPVRMNGGKKKTRGKKGRKDNKKSRRH
jgi:hypothetical protein